MTPRPEDYELAVTRPDGSTHVLFRPHPGKQTEYLADLTTKNLFLVGPRGTGKSKLARFQAHSLAMAFPNLSYLVVRNQYRDLNTGHLVHMDAEMQALGGSFHSTQGIAKYPNGSVGFYAAMDRPEDATRVLGAEFMLGIADEAPEIPFETLMRIRASLRAPKEFPFRPVFRMLGNPCGESIDTIWEFCVDHSVDRDLHPRYRPEEWGHLTMTLADNPSIDAEEYLAQFVGLPDHIVEAWVHGRRSDPGSLFRLIPTKTVSVPQPDGTMREKGEGYHLIDDVPIIDGVPVDQLPWVQIVGGYDHGFDPDPAVLIRVAAVGRRLVVLSEQTWNRTVIKDIAAEITETWGPKPKRISADPSLGTETGAGWTLLDQFAQHGIPMDPSKNDRELFVTIWHELLNQEVSPGTPRIQIVQSRCPQLVKTLPKLKGHPQHPHRLGHSTIDHWAIATVYAVLMLGLTSTAPPSRRVMPQRQWWEDALVPRI